MSSYYTVGEASDEGSLKVLARALELSVTLLDTSSARILLISAVQMPPERLPPHPSSTCRKLAALKCCGIAAAKTQLNRCRRLIRRRTLLMQMCTASERTSA